MGSALGKWLVTMSREVMHRPFILIDDSGIGQVYPDAGDLEASIEGIEAESGDVRVFDTDGHAIRLLVDPDGFRVGLDGLISEETHLDEVTAALRKFIRWRGPHRFGLSSADVDSASTARLLAKATEYREARRGMRGLFLRLKELWQ